MEVKNWFCSIETIWTVPAQTSLTDAKCIKHLTSYVLGLCSKVIATLITDLFSISRFCVVSIT